MRIKELEAKFQSEETLDQVLEELKLDFESVDRNAGDMKNGIADNPQEVIRILGELTGTFSNLRTALSVSESQKKNREIGKYVALKIEQENQGKRFVSATGEIEASESVKNYRRITNIIEGYKEACQIAISSLQSLLKYLITEKNQPVE